MSKAVGSVLGTNVKANTRAGENYLSYLQNIDTTLADKASSAMATEANQMAQSLLTAPEMVYGVDGSDMARQRTENATYQAYLDKLLPQHKTQMADLETRLANQGLSVGSQAYQRAVNDLTSQHNDALNQAAYNSVLKGQEAFSNSLKDSINAGSFTNNARQSGISQIYGLLQNSPSSYENQANIYAVQQGIANQQANAKQQSFNNTMGALSAIGNTAGYAAGFAI